MAPPQMISQMNGVRRNDLLAAVFPPRSDERYRAVNALGNAIHMHLQRIRIIPASSILYCTIFVQCFLHLEQG